MGRRLNFPDEKLAHLMKPEVSLQFLHLCWPAVCRSHHLHHGRTGLVSVCTSRSLFPRLFDWGYLFELDFTSWKLGEP